MKNINNKVFRGGIYYEVTWPYSIFNEDVDDFQILLNVEKCN